MVLTTCTHPPLAAPDYKKILNLPFHRTHGKLTRTLIFPFGFFHSYVGLTAAPARGPELGPQRQAAGPFVGGNRAHGPV